MIPPRVVFLGVAALLLALTGVGAVVTHEDDEEMETAAVTTTTSLSDTTTTMAPATTELPPTTVAGSTSTTAGTATTTVVRTTTTRRPPGPTTTAVTADCTAAQIDVAATTDRASYAVGQQVKVDSTLRNGSSTTCFYAGHTFRVTILSPAGATIISFDVVTPGQARTPFAPGATLTGSVPWDQRTCQAPPCSQPPPGSYSAVARWTFAGGPYEARATFDLTGS